MFVFLKSVVVLCSNNILKIKLFVKLERSFLYIKIKYFYENRD